MKIIIIGNSNLDNLLIEKINKNISIEKEDIVARINSTNLLNIFENHTTHYYARYTYTNGWFLNLKNPPFNNNGDFNFINNKFNNTISVNVMYNEGLSQTFENDSITKIIKKKHKINIIKFKEILNYEKDPSTGFIIIVKFFEKYKNFKNVKFILLGFTFQGWNGHAWNIEKNYVFDFKKKYNNLYLINDLNDLNENISKNINFNKIGGNPNLYNFDKKDTIVIVGLAPSIEKYIKNYHNFKSFDHLSLGRTINFDFNFKYFLINDLNTIKYDEIKNLNGGFDKNWNGNYDIYKIDKYSNFLESALIKKTKIFFGFVRNGNKHISNLDSNFYKIKKFWNDVYFDTTYYNDIEINKSIDDFNKTKYLGKFGTTSAQNAIILSIMLGYKNILLAGISGNIKNYSDYYWNDNYKKIMEQVNKYYSNVKISILYPNDETKNIFHNDIN